MSKELEVAYRALEKLKATIAKRDDISDSDLEPDIPYFEDGYIAEFGTKKIAPLLTYGWYGPEGSFRWSRGDASCLKFRLRELVDVLTLSIEVAPILTDNIEHQRLTVVFNGVSQGGFSVSDQQSLKIKIPSSIQNRDNINTLEFAYLDAISPFDADISEDKRTLAIAFHSIKVHYE